MTSQDEITLAAIDASHIDGFHRARKAGFVRVELHVHADNTRAIALCERFGFLREGVARDAVCIDGHYVDAISMAIVYR